MYCCAEHEGKINAGVLPQAKRSGRPPKRFAKAAPSEHAPPTVVTPGPMMQRESSAGSCGPSIPAQAPLPTEDTLHKLLRKVGLGQYVQEFQRQGATLAAVTALSVDGLRTFFGFDLGQAHALKTAIDALPTASASSAPSSAVSPRAPVCASAWLCLYSCLHTWPLSTFPSQVPAVTSTEEPPAAAASETQIDGTNHK